MACDDLSYKRVILLDLISLTCMPICITLLGRPAITPIFPQSAKTSGQQLRTERRHDSFILTSNICRCWHVLHVTPIRSSLTQVNSGGLRHNQTEHAPCAHGSIKAAINHHRQCLISARVSTSYSTTLHFMGHIYVSTRWRFVYSFVRSQMMTPAEHRFRGRAARSTQVQDNPHVWTCPRGYACVSRSDALGVFL